MVLDRAASCGSVGAAASAVAAAATAAAPASTLALLLLLVSLVLCCCCCFCRTLPVTGRTQGVPGPHRGSGLHALRADQASPLPDHREQDVRARLRVVKACQRCRSMIDLQRRA